MVLWRKLLIIFGRTKSITLLLFQLRCLKNSKEFHFFHSRKKRNCSQMILSLNFLLHPYWIFFSSRLFFPPYSNSCYIKKKGKKMSLAYQYPVPLPIWKAMLPNTRSWKTINKSNLINLDVIDTNGRYECFEALPL